MILVRKYCPALLTVAQMTICLYMYYSDMQTPTQSACVYHDENNEFNSGCQLTFVVILNWCNANTREPVECNSAKSHD